MTVSCASPCGIQKAVLAYMFVTKSGPSLSTIRWRNASYGNNQLIPIVVKKRNCMQHVEEHIVMQSYTRKRTHTHTHAQSHTIMRNHRHVYIYIYIYICRCTCKWICMYMHMYVYEFACADVNAYVYCNCKCICM